MLFFDSFQLVHLGVDPNHHMNELCAAFVDVSKEHSECALIGLLQISDQVCREDSV